MAATVSAWGKPGAWALDSEQEEQQQRHQEEEDYDKKKMFAPSAVASAQPLADFPLLSAAVTTKTKKKKPQAVSLAEFTSGKSSTVVAKALTTTELLSLPTGPRERSAEELERSSRLGGGFRSYGSSSSSSDHNSNNNSSRWGRGSDSSDEPRRNREPAPPSKADEVDDWGAAKKSAAVSGGGVSSFDRRDRDRDRGSGGGFFDSHSRADGSDNWLSKKSPLSSEPRRFDRDRRGGGGGGFERDSSNDGGGALSDSWVSKRGDLPVSNGRPKLVLQPRSQTPTGGEAGVVANKSNPFGEARPREQVLADKGQDWKKIDEQLESVKVKEIASDGSTAFGKKSFGNGNGRVRSPDGDRTEKSWRKAVSDDSPPSSVVEADKEGDDGVGTEN